MVLPAIDVKGGRCVQLVGGKPGTERVQIDDVMAVARRWQAAGAEMIHIVDLDAALGTGNNERLIEMVVASLSVPVQVGGGIRTPERVKRLFDIGCERVVIGTKAVEDQGFAQEMAKQYPDSIVVAVDAVAEEVFVRGWQESSGKTLGSVVAAFEQSPIFGFLYTNIEVEGKLQGIDPAPVKALIERTRKPVIVSGGITTMGDLDLLRRMGAHSAIVGMAIYTGKIDLREAVRVFR